MTDLQLVVGTDSSVARSDIRQLAQAVGAVERAADKTTTSLQDVAKSGTAGLDKVAASASRASDEMGGLHRLAKQVATSLSIGAGVFAIGKAADQATQLRNKLSLVAQTQAEVVGLQARLYDLSVRTRSSVSSTVSLYYGLNNAMKETYTGAASVLAVTEAVNKSLELSGASAESAGAAITQLVQGLSAGTLRGEELNSVIEQTPRLAKMLADGLSVGVGQLKALGEAGVLTTSKVVDAIASQAQRIDQEFSKTNATLGFASKALSRSMSNVIGVVDGLTGASSRLARGMLSIGAYADKAGAGTDSFFASIRAGFSELQVDAKTMAPDIISDEWLIDQSSTVRKFLGWFGQQTVPELDYSYLDKYKGWVNNANPSDIMSLSNADSKSHTAEDLAAQATAVRDASLQIRATVADLQSFWANSIFGGGWYDSPNNYVGLVMRSTVSAYESAWAKLKALIGVSSEEVRVPIREIARDIYSIAMSIASGLASVAQVVVQNLPRVYLPVLDASTELSREFQNYSSMGKAWAQQFALPLTWMTESVWDFANVFEDKRLARAVSKAFSSESLAELEGNVREASRVLRDGQHDWHNRVVTITGRRTLWRDSGIREFFAETFRFAQTVGISLGIFDNKLLRFGQIRFDRLAWGLSVVRDILVQIYEDHIKYPLSAVATNLMTVVLGGYITLMDTLNDNLSFGSGKGLGKAIQRGLYSAFDWVVATLRGDSLIATKMDLILHDVMHGRFRPYDWFGNNIFADVADRLLPDFAKLAWHLSQFAAGLFHGLMDQPIQDMLRPIRGMIRSGLDAIAGKLYGDGVFTRVGRVMSRGFADAMDGIFGSSYGGDIAAEASRAASMAADAVQIALSRLSARLPISIDLGDSFRDGLDAIGKFSAGVAKELHLTELKQALILLGKYIKLTVKSWFSDLSMWEELQRSLLHSSGKLAIKAWLQSVKSEFLDTYDRIVGLTENLVSRVGSAASRLVQAPLEFVRAFTHAVDRAFYAVWDAVVGHCYWPDLVNGVTDWAKRLLTDAQPFVQKFVSTVERLFQAVAARVAGIMGHIRSGDLAVSAKSYVGSMMDALANFSAANSNNLGDMWNTLGENTGLAIGKVVTAARGKLQLLTGNLSLIQNGDLKELARNIESTLSRSVAIAFTTGLLLVFGGGTGVTILLGALSHVVTSGLVAPFLDGVRAITGTSIPAEMGRMLGTGAAVFAKAMIASVIDAIKVLTQAAPPAMEAFLAEFGAIGRMLSHFIGYAFNGGGAFYTLIFGAGGIAAYREGFSGIVKLAAEAARLVGVLFKPTPVPGAAPKAASGKEGKDSGNSMLMAIAGSTALMSGMFGAIGKLNLTGNVFTHAIGDGVSAIASLVKSVAGVIAAFSNAAWTAAHWVGGYVPIVGDLLDIVLQVMRGVTSILGGVAVGVPLLAMAILGESGGARFTRELRGVVKPAISGTIQMLKDGLINAVGKLGFTKALTNAVSGQQSQQSIAGAAKTLAGVFGTSFAAPMSAFVGETTGNLLKVMRNIAANKEDYGNGSIGFYEMVFGRAGTAQMTSFMTSFNKLKMSLLFLPGDLKFAWRELWNSLALAGMGAWYRVQDAAFIAWQANRAMLEPLVQAWGVGIASIGSAWKKVAAATVAMWGGTMGALRAIATTLGGSLGAIGQFLLGGSQKVIMALITAVAIFFSVSASASERINGSISSTADKLRSIGATLAAAVGAVVVGAPLLMGLAKLLRGDIAGAVLAVTNGFRAQRDLLVSIGGLLSAIARGVWSVVASLGSMLAGLRTIGIGAAIAGGTAEAAAFMVAIDKMGAKLSAWGAAAGAMWDNYLRRVQLAKLAMNGIGGIDASVSPLRSAKAAAAQEAALAAAGKAAAMQAEASIAARTAAELAADATASRIAKRRAQRLAESTAAQAAAAVAASKLAEAAVPKAAGTAARGAAEGILSYAAAMEAAGFAATATAARSYVAKQATTSFLGTLRAGIGVALQPFTGAIAGVVVGIGSFVASLLGVSTLVGTIIAGVAGLATVGIIGVYLLGEGNDLMQRLENVKDKAWALITGMPQANVMDPRAKPLARAIAPYDQTETIGSYNFSNKLQSIDYGKMNEAQYTTMADQVDTLAEAMKRLNKVSNDHISLQQEARAAVTAAADALDRSIAKTEKSSITVERAVQIQQEFLQGIAGDKPSFLERWANLGVRDWFGDKWRATMDGIAAGFTTIGSSINAAMSAAAKFLGMGSEKTSDGWMSKFGRYTSDEYKRRDRANKWFWGGDWIGGKGSRSDSSARMQDKQDYYKMSFEAVNAVRPLMTQEDAALVDKTTLQLKKAFEDVRAIEKLGPFKDTSEWKRLNTELQQAESNYDAISQRFIEFGDNAKNNAETVRMLEGQWSGWNQISSMVGMGPSAEDNSKSAQIGNLMNANQMDQIASIGKSQEEIVNQLIGKDFHQKLTMETAVQLRVNWENKEATKKTLAEIFQSQPIVSRSIEWAVKISGTELTPDELMRFYANNKAGFTAWRMAVDDLANAQTDLNNAQTKGDPKLAQRALEARDAAKRKVDSLTPLKAPLEELNSLASKLSLPAVDATSFAKAGSAASSMRDQLKQLVDQKESLQRDWADGKLSLDLYQSGLLRIETAAERVKRSLDAMGKSTNELAVEKLQAFGASFEKLAVLSDAKKQKYLDVYDRMDADKKIVDSPDKYSEDIRIKAGKEYVKLSKQLQKSFEDQPTSIFDRFSQFAQSGGVTASLEQLIALGPQLRGSVIDSLKDLYQQYRKLQAAPGLRTPADMAKFAKDLKAWKAKANAMEDTLAGATTPLADAVGKAIDGVKLEDIAGAGLAATRESLANIGLEIQQQEREIQRFTAAGVAEESAMVEAAYTKIRDAKKKAADQVASLPAPVLTGFANSSFNAGIQPQQMSVMPDSSFEKMRELMTKLVILRAQLSNPVNMTTADWQSALTEQLRAQRELIALGKVGIEQELFKIEIDGVDLTYINRDVAARQRMLDTVKQLSAEYQEWAALRDKVNSDQATPVELTRFQTLDSRRTLPKSLADNAAELSTLSGLVNALKLDMADLQYIPGETLGKLKKNREELALLYNKLQNLGADQTEKAKELNAEIAKRLKAETEITDQIAERKQLVGTFKSAFADGLKGMFHGKSTFKDLKVSIADASADALITRLSNSMFDGLSKMLANAISAPANSTAGSAGFGAVLGAAMSDNKAVGARNGAAIGLAAAPLLSEYGPKMWESVKSTFAKDGALSSVGDTFREGGALSGVGSFFGSLFGGDPTGKVDGSEKNPFWVRLWDGVTAIGGGAADTAKKAGGGIMDALGLGGKQKDGDKKPGMMDSAKEWASGAWDSVKSKASEMWDSISKSTSEMMDGLTGLFSDMGSQITDMLSNIDWGAFAGMLGLPAFDTGGVVGGPIGAPQLALVHSGETILPTHKKDISEFGFPSGKSSSAVINLSITGDVSRQTKKEVLGMLPQIAAGVNAHNRESNYRR